MIRRVALAFILILAMTLHSAPARADCTLTSNGQTRPPGALIYEGANNLVLYCADTVWKALVFNAVGGGGAECPASAPIYGENPSGNYYYDIWKQGNYIYTAEHDGANGMVSAFTFDGTAWTYIDTETFGTADTWSVWSDGAYIYVAQDSAGVQALSFDGTAFTLIATYDTPGAAYDVWGDGTYIYVADGAAGVHALTFNGTAWNFIATYNSPDTAGGVWGDGTYIYLADDDTVRALTFNGTAWSFIAAQNNPGDNDSVWGDGTYIYVNEAWTGIRALSFNGTAWTDLGVLDLNSDGDVYAEGGYVFLAGIAAAALTFDGVEFTVQGYYPAYPSASSVFSDGTYIYATGDFGGVNAYAGCTGGGASTGYFVLTETEWDGNLGDFAGANSKCLNELTTNTNWKYHAEANSAGLLTAANVKAFLCYDSDDNGTCQNLAPEVNYYFARVGSATAGGASFKTANLFGVGVGPGDNADWSDAAHFDGIFGYWSSRWGGSAIAFPEHSYSSGGDCIKWTSASSGLDGDVGTGSSTDVQRWAGGTVTCDIPMRLICMVNP